MATSSLGWDNFYSTTLSSAITDSDTTIPVTTAPTATEGYLVIEPDSASNREIIYYTSVSGSNVVLPSVGAGRGVGGTTARAHSSGVVVKMNTVAEMFEALQDASSWASDVKGGWVAASGTWSYSSWDSTNKTGVITVPSGATSIYSAGMRIRISQSTGGTKYGIITAVASTSLTVYFGTDYTLNNETISSPHYSVHKAPLGFPLDPAKWTVSNNYTDDNNVTTIAQVGTHQITLPIGSWYVKMHANIRIVCSGNNATALQVGLSTSTSSFTDADLSGILRNPAVASLVGSVQLIVAVQKTITVASATTYYQVGERSGAALTCSVDGNGYVGLIEAVCAYL